MRSDLMIAHGDQVSTFRVLGVVEDAMLIETGAFTSSALPYRCDGDHISGRLPRCLACIKFETH